MPSWSQQVRDKAERLARASVEGMYQDAFWEARYGERARRLGDEDALYHVRTLVLALELHRPAVMEDYARWLRTVLVSRGMCTPHLDENLQRLAQALLDEGFPPDSPPLACVAAGRAALRYPQGPARALQDEASPLALRCAARLRPEQDSRRGALEWELRRLLGYVADALGAGRPELWLQHCHWYAGFWPRRGLGGLGLPAVLEVLEQALGRHDEARALVAAARGLEKTVSL